MKHNIIKITGIVLLICCSAFTVFSQTENLSKVDILGQNYYVYQAKKGDSLFGIAREFNWDYTKLQNLNPNAISPLAKGMKIYYPVEGMNETPQATSDINITPAANTIEDELKTPEIYTIKRGDTLYALAKKYNTTVAAIMQANPGVSEKNFRAGEKIKLPQSGEGVKTIKQTIEEDRLASVDMYKVGKNETWESVASKTGVDVDELKSLNKDTGSKLKNKTILAVPNITKVSIDTVVAYQDPRELSPEGIRDIYEDVHGLNDSVAETQIKFAVLLDEPTTKKDIDYTRGILSGINYLKSKGVSIDLKVMNGNQSSTDLLSQLADYVPDMVFLTSEKGIPGYLAEYAEISQTPMVNTFDLKNELYTTNPYIVQLLTPSNYFNEIVAQKLAEDYADYTMIFVGDEDETDQLVAPLKDKWTPSKVKSLSLQGLKKATFKPDGKFLFYGLGVKKDDIEGLLSRVEEIRKEYPLADIVTVGRPNWIVYEESLKQDLHNANTVIPSRFYYDTDSSLTNQLLKNYNSLFDGQPTKSYPMYAALGFDTMLYFLPEYARTKGDLNLFVSSDNGSQNSFELVRPNNWTGFYNDQVYLIRFTPYNTIEKQLIK